MNDTIPPSSEVQQHHQDQVEAEVRRANIILTAVLVTGAVILGLAAVGAVSIIRRFL